MRLTPETLISIARETAVKLSLAEPGLVAVYLTGSLLGSSPFLGGTADIDLVCVQDPEVSVRREVLPKTPDVHLDLLRRARREYEKPRELRLHPWLGPELYEAQPLFTRSHFFEFIQAGVRDRFLDPASVLARSRVPLRQAREVWLGLAPSGEAGAGAFLSYLEAVGLAAQALALLTGGPLGERRLLLDFPARAAAAGAAELAGELSDLLGGRRADRQTLKELLPDWEACLRAASERPDPELRLAPPRLRYYQAPLQALLESEDPLACLWMLLHTWTLASSRLSPARQARWQAGLDRLGLTAEAFPGQLERLDLFLDRVEEQQEALAIRQGLTGASPAGEKR